MPMMDRRGVLRANVGLAGTFGVMARAPDETDPMSPPRAPLAAEGALSFADLGMFRFPQGVASADPLPDQIVLWTRVESTAGESGEVSVTVEMALNETFAEIVLTRTVAVMEASDHTLRIIAQGLNPDTFYFYRFRAGADVSRTGRTRTAPAPEADCTVRFAFASCQNHEQGFYGAWARRVADGAARPADDQLDVALFLGDFSIDVRDAEKGFGPMLDYVPFTPIQNATGQPAINIPLHWNVDNLPIGVQFVGRFGDETTLLQRAGQLEQELPWAAHHDTLWA